MSIAVIGCGRSGTNLVLEILRGSSVLDASPQPENKDLCGGTYEPSYLTKCDTWYFLPEELGETLEKNTHMKIVWTIRDPRDMILSKIKRGQPKSEGGDGSESVSDDATVTGCLVDMTHMFMCYSHIKKNFPDRILVVRMEDVLLNVEEETKRMCEFLDIPFENDMCDFPNRMRNKDKKKRYSKIDKSQLEVWKRWDSVYSGFFSENEYPIEEMYNSSVVFNIKKEFGYAE